MPIDRAPCRLRIAYKATGTGVGKTDLIKAIVQSADTIVHVDTITPPRGRRSQTRGPARSSSSSRHSNTTKHIFEVLASTKPRPEWWSDLNDPDVSRRRKSSSDGDTIPVLDRNLCFVDTPGYNCGSSANLNFLPQASVETREILQCMEAITPTIRYVESFLQMVAANGSTGPDMLSMLGGDGGNQVDAVLYLIKTSRSAPFSLCETMLTIC